MKLSPSSTIETLNLYRSGWEINIFHHGVHGGPRGKAFALFGRRGAADTAALR